jgi:hypothetical protein
MESFTTEFDVHSSRQTEKLSFFVYSWTVPILVGIPGNILAVIVATQRYNRKLSTSVFIAAIGVVDSLFLSERLFALLTVDYLIQNDILEYTLWMLR